jgi:hypothetical protein
MYGKLKQLSIEELEVEIEDLDIEISKLLEDRNEIDRQVRDLTKKFVNVGEKITGLRALSKICSDLILEKQKEETQ